MANKFNLIHNNWDALNAVLNESEELQKMLNDAAGKIFTETKAAVEATNSRQAGWVSENTEYTIVGATEETGLIMRFVSIPSIGFEMRYSPLGRSLKND